MAKSKEEILKPYLWGTDKSDDICNDYDALKAMDEYAKQNAIGFAEWKERCGYRCKRNKGQYMWHIPLSNLEYTTGHLYDIYLNSKQK